MRDEPRVFVSYAASDRAFADRLIDQLRDSEVAVHVDRVNLKHGDQMLSAMRSQIEAADFLVLLLSPQALESPWVPRELEYAVSTELRQRSITVVPLKVQPCRVPHYLEAWMVIDATRDFEKAVHKLAGLLRAAPLVQLERLDPRQFESLIADLLKSYGFTQVTTARGSMDAGFDFSAQSIQRDPFGRLETVDWLVEVKASRRQADLSTLRPFLGTLSLRKERGLFVTSGQVTTPAREWLESVVRSGGPRISLMEGTEVKRLVIAKPRLVEKYFGDKGQA
jgi:restriction endonuclease Mrr